MTRKKVKCPICGVGNICFLYATTMTLFYCQNLECPSAGKQAFKSYHWSDDKYPAIIDRVDWNYTWEETKRVEVEHDEEA